MRVIAELGSNWRTDDPSKDKERLLALLGELANIGVSALKLQLFKADKLYSRERGPNLHEKVKWYEFPLDWLPDLATRSLGKLRLWASVFDTETARTAAPYLDGIKIASGDITNHHLIGYVAKLASEYNLTLALSTGAAYYGEIDTAFAIAQGSYNNDVVVFHCVSAYPSRAIEQRLRNIDTIRDLLPDGVILGYSDHTKRTLPAQLALARGCSYFEKHFRPEHTTRANPDYKVSVTMKQLDHYIRGLEIAQHIMGSPRRNLCSAEIIERRMARRGSDGLRPAH